MGTSHSSWSRLMTLFAQDKIRAEKMVSETFPLSDWKTGFTKMKNKEGYRFVLIP